MDTTVDFPPDRDTYIRSHVTLAAVAMAGAMAVLWVMGNAHIWTGAVAGLAGIGVRGWYLASEELAVRWRLEGDTLRGPGERVIPLVQIEQVRHWGHFVQIITTGGDKHLIKYQADAAATAATLERVRS